MTLAIAIVALVLAAAACVAAWLAVSGVGRIEAAIAEIADADEDEPEPETAELWLSDGEFYCADRNTLAAALPGVMGFVTIEGVPSAVMPNGVWSLHKLLSDKPAVRSIK